MSTWIAWGVYTCWMLLLGAQDQALKRLLQCVGQGRMGTRTVFGSFWRFYPSPQAEYSSFLQVDRFTVIALTCLRTDANHAK
ncbi:hypothetical protein BDP81DRAFT_33244 [Colletotrichum phormii]|uniref:Secreted protein n=1 Tax=Colletotrichum phormii TaxID=359342 RepID=A0AAI9ZSK5_9PEZI|nr:uncharacterized protein BDP81DRAFT_33244 [Colletotrichum phormii]KAK1636074.1 hypothetical protein BDP81DRAFT_33244 [Colletotrichum phormii]